ncbi:hypothetical protein H072_5295 [Dactylellina haptotyla CBS 200.50]|uniref:DUF676 domain-containing protein n=1 Tax=Dactylellina haptotyla (strain CBS 200.50) TaxID=1284197 RepID=S8BZV8_DACHA|nr:hypothetical protein H072_5295 [Dactylellina haptotyla CBS 200.50]
MAGVHRRWTHLAPGSASVPNTTNPHLHPYQSPNDKRTSSTASLLPQPSALEAIQSGESTQRTLLCVFIHGFVGDETSFRSFPAHFHELLTILVQETHVVHTKVYPKFKTRDKISLAVRNFSEWLSQFESPTTDTILIGHSMGGLLAVDVALLPFPPGRHRILGTISFDTPFIGIHPGVVKSGLASLFKPADKPLPDPEIPGNYYSRTSVDSDDTTSIFSSSSGHSNNTFIPPSMSKPKKSAWQSGLDFWKKHQGGVRRAAIAYVNGHLEFSGALLDFNVMKRRYKQIKALDKPDIDDRRRLLFGGSTGDHAVFIPRVRFVNYYTVSTGRAKQERSKSHTRGVGDDGVPAVVTPNGEIVTGGSSGAITPISPLPDTEVAIPVSLVVSSDSVYSAPPPEYSPGNHPAHQVDDKPEMNPSAFENPTEQSAQEYTEARKKESTFCIIPKEQDSCWVKVMMENVDEVGAHCGLFFINGVPAVDSPSGVGSPGQHASPGREHSDCAEAEIESGGVYERLLGDVTQRIEGWCRDWVDEIRMNPNDTMIDVTSPERELMAISYSRLV